MSYYVSMIDRFLSGWGPAEGKRNILIITCDTSEQAHAVHQAALRREEMYGVQGVMTEHPGARYDNAEYYHVSEKHVSELGPIWTGGES